MPTKNSPDQRSHKSVKQAHSQLERRLVPFLLIFMAVVMGAMILFAVGVIAGVIKY